MSATTSIEWCDATWNAVRGCSRVSPGCGGPGKQGGCYAEIMAARFSKPGQWGHGFAEMVGSAKTRDHRWTGKVELIESQLLLPMKWRAPRRIFVNSTSDLFHENLSDAAIDRVFAVMALAPQHTYQILTKRAKRMRDYCTPPRLTNVMNAATRIGGAAALVGREGWPLQHVWLGVSVEDQERADERIPDLLATPAAVRFISAEPLLGPVDLEAVAEGYALCGRQTIYLPRGKPDIHPPISDDTTIGDAVKNLGGSIVPVHGAIDWVIAGGESGPGARPMELEWARALKDQCAAAGVAFFMKQMSGLAGRAIKDMDLFPADLRVREFPQ